MTVTDVRSTRRLSSDWESTRLKIELSPVQIREAAFHFCFVGSFRVASLPKRIELCDTPASIVTTRTATGWLNHLDWAALVINRRTDGRTVAAWARSRSIRSGHRRYRPLRRRHGKLCLNLADGRLGVGPRRPHRVLTVGSLEYFRGSVNTGLQTPGRCRRERLDSCEMLVTVEQIQIAPVSRCRVAIQSRPERLLVASSVSTLASGLP